jgi:acyl carrier protein
MNNQARIILQKVLGADVIENLSDEVDLIESGLLDSLLAFQLIAEIQEEFQVDLLSESVTLDFIRTISKLNQWIDGQSL